MPLFNTDNNCFLHYEIKKPASQQQINVVLIHGYLSNSQCWQGYASLLGDNVCLVTVDLYSHGLSSWVNPAADADEDLENARDIALLMKHLSLHPYFVVGHSFGGRVSGLIAAQDKENVKGAVLITPVPLQGMRTSVADTTKAIMDTLQSQNIDAFHSLLVDYHNGGFPVRKNISEEFMDSMRHSCLKEGSNIVSRSLSLQANRSSIISSVSSPLLFLTADKDMFFKQTLEELSLFCSVSPNVHCFHNAAHFFPVVIPTETAKVISTFLNYHSK